MMLRRMMLVGLLGGLALGTAACTDGYGYSGVGVGVGAGPGYYGDPYYAGGYGTGYYGWYGDYYYPGTGRYVYDRYRRAHRWNGAQQRYWQQRRYGVNHRDVRANWRDFGRDDRGEVRSGTITRDQLRQQRRDARREYRPDVRRDGRDLRRQNRAEGARTPRPDRAFRPRRDR